MSKFSIVSGPNSDPFVVILKSRSDVIQVIKSEKLKKSIGINEYEVYDLFYSDFSSPYLYYCTLTPENCPNPTFSLLFSHPNNGPALITLQAEIKRIKFTINDRTTSLNYLVDEEPLVELNTSYVSDNRSEGLYSEALHAKIENYDLIIEHEKKLREKAEQNNKEVLRIFENSIKNSREKIEKLEKETIFLKEEKILMGKEIEELKIQCEKYVFEIEKGKELQEFQILALKNEKSVNDSEELEFYKGFMMKSEKKWQNFIEKMEGGNEDDPIGMILKGKDEEIAELTKKVSELSKNALESEIEKHLSTTNLPFSKQNCLVYSISGVKVVVFLSSQSFLLRSIGRYIKLEELSEDKVHNRTVSEISTPKPASKKQFFSGKKGFSSLKKS